MILHLIINSIYLMASANYSQDYSGEYGIIS